MRLVFTLLIFITSAATGAVGVESPSPSSRAGTACQLHRIEDASVPECPASGGGVLSDSYPAMAVSLSDELGKSKWVQSFVFAVLEAQPDKPPQFLLNVTPKTFADVQRMIHDYAGKDEKKKKLWLSALTRAKTDKVYNWQQDIMKSVVVGGKPQMRANANYPRMGTAEVKNAVIEAAREACDVPTGAAYAKSLKSADPNGLMGGNIQGGPGGLCLVGDNQLRGEEWSKLTGDICGNNPKMRTPTSFMTVGHTDEIYSSVRTGPGPCDVAILVASPKAAREALQKDAQGLALKLLYDFKKGKYREGNISVGYSQLCEALRRRTNEMDQSPNGGKKTVAANEPPETPRRGPASIGSSAVDEKEDNGPGTKHRIRPPASSKRPSDDSIKRRMDEECESRLITLKNDELLDTLNREPNLALLNDEIEKKMVQFRGDLEKEFSDKGCPKPKIVEMPTIFQGESDYDANSKKVSATNSTSIFSNPTNMQQFGNTLMMSDPGNDALRRDLQDRISALSPSLKIKFIDTQFAHLNQGNLHCSTNAIRYCRPKGAK